MRELVMRYTSIIPPGNYVAGGGLNCLEFCQDMLNPYYCAGPVVLGILDFRCKVQPAKGLVEPLLAQGPIQINKQALTQSA